MLLNNGRLPQNCIEYLEYQGGQPMQFLAMTVYYCANKKISSQPKLRGDKPNTLRFYYKTGRTERP